MSIFGKVMAAFNVVGVLAVLVMAILVYGERKSWQYIVFRYDLAMYGLPLTEEDTDKEEYTRYLDLGSKEDKTLKELFPNNPVTTQREEVQRVKAILDSRVNSVSNDWAAQSKELATILLPLSATNAQREELIAIKTQCDNEKAMHDKMEAAYPKAIAAVTADPKKSFAKEFSLAMRFPGPPPNPKGPPKGLPLLMDNDPRDPFEKALGRAVQGDPPAPAELTKKFDDAYHEAVEAVSADLKNQYETAFDEALKGTHNNGSRPVDITPEQRRHAIAHLLVSLDDSLPKDESLNADAFSVPAFQRVIKVIGIEEMDRELSAEAVQLTAISLEQDKSIERDRIAFATTHDALIFEAHSAAQTLAQQTDQVNELEAKYTAQKVLADNREKNVNDSKDELARRRKYTRDMLDIVNKMTDGIHSTRIDVRDANTLNQEYVQKIKNLETKR